MCYNINHRIHAVYKMVKILKSPYQPRPLQKEMHNKSTRFTVLVCHRRFGKTIFAINHIISKLLTCDKNRPQYAYIAPEKSQAKKIAWEYLKEYTNFLPNVRYYEAELKCEIELPNKTKGIIYLEGAENPERLRGMYFDGVILDEVAQMPKSIWTEVVRPALSDRMGWAVFIGTPKGRNYFKEVYSYAEDEVMAKDGWSSFMYKASESKVIPDAELESLKRQMSSEEYAQEYECDFEAAIPGTYYGKQIAMLRNEGQIGEFNYNKNVPVFTAWDIGLNDKTVIWFAQFINNKIYIIDYYENSDASLVHYINYIKGKPYTYEYHIVPHDVNVRSFTDGLTRLSQMESAGLKCTVAKRLSIQEGINAVINILPICNFDEKKCDKGLSALSYYHSTYSDRNDVQQLIPVHDWSSHAADAFRYLAVGRRNVNQWSESGHSMREDLSKEYSWDPLDNF